MPKSLLLTEVVSIPPLDRAKKTEKENKYLDDGMMFIFPRVMQEKRQ
jgi:hypothetical protein